MKTVLIAMFVAVCLSCTVKAADVVVRIGGGYVSGHYEVKCENVLVEPGHFVKEWVEPRIVVRIDDNGKPVKVVSEGYYRETWVPDRYEVREVRTWVPGYYIERRPTFFFGLGGWSHHNYNHGHRR